MNGRNSLEVVVAGIFKAVKCVIMGIAWCIIVMCVLIRNR